MKYKLPRNNTNFQMYLLEYFRKKEWEPKYSFLKYYQNVARSFVVDLDTGARGILIKHQMGLGKSILAVAIAVDLITERQPIVLLTKSLRGNMIRSIYKYIALRKQYDSDFYLCNMTDRELEQWINKNFSFVSMNASNMLKQLSKATEGTAAEEFENVLEARVGEVLKVQSLDGKLLIIDEAHNIFRAITNGSKNAQGLYHKIISSKNLKVVFLTGTPIANNPFELAVCFNMIGNAQPHALTFPEDYMEFNKLYVDESNKTIKNKAKFQNRIVGLVSSVKHTTTPGAAFGISTDVKKAEFPDQLPLIVELCNMAPEQYVAYQLARDKEKDEGKGGSKIIKYAPLTIPKSNSSSSYRVMSRQLSNNFRGVSPKIDKLIENLDKHKHTLGLVYSQFVGEGGTGALIKVLKQQGWQQYGAFGKKIVEEDPTVGLDITELVEKEGEYEAIDQRSHSDISWIHTAPAGGWWTNNQVTGGADKVRRYAIISGEVDSDDRIIVQDVFNGSDNQHGEQIELLVVSAAAAEGLDFKNIRHIHIMEPYWNWGRVMQIISRGVRSDSHIDLPPEEKNVQPYIYLAVPPKSEQNSDGTYAKTTDVEFYEDSLLDEAINNSFNDAIDEVSIERNINNETPSHQCSPTNTPLYTDDPARDIRTEDPCKEIVSEKIKATEIQVADNKYYYMKNEKSPFGLSIFKFDVNIDSWRQMKESDPLFLDLVDAINAL